MKAKWEITADDWTTWVNDDQGISRARYSARLRHMDIHVSFEEQCRTGRQCAACGPGSWEDFVTTCRQVLGVEVSEEHKPRKYEKRMKTEGRPYR